MNEVRIDETGTRISATILQADVPTRTGRIYPRHVLDEVCREIKGEQVIGVVFDGDPMVGPVLGPFFDLRDAAVMFNVSQDETGSLHAEGDILDTRGGERLRELISQGKFVIGVTSGTGKVEGDCITEFELSHVVLTVDDDANE